MKTKINLLLKIIMILAVIAMGSAAILQIFIPSFLGSTSEYGLNPGWQREIGFWNIGFVAVLIGTLIKGDGKTVTIVASGGSILAVGFGINHLLGFIRDTSMYMSLFGALENFLFAGLIILGLIKQIKLNRAHDESPIKNL
ncbi:MAG: hypothetical protein FWC34_03430 [Bacteroidetes bacterium]|nr:hypothetical protein [Bacteroidota bacterium]